MALETSHPSDISQIRLESIRPNWVDFVFRLLSLCWSERSCLVKYTLVQFINRSEVKVVMPFKQLQQMLI